MLNGAFSGKVRRVPILSSMIVEVTIYLPQTVPN